MVSESILLTTALYCKKQQSGLSELLSYTTKKEHNSWANKMINTNNNFNSFLPFEANFLHKLYLYSIKCM